MTNLLSTKPKLAATDLKGPRVYSTDLLVDTGLVDEKTPAITARALKIKLITKGLVTLNSAYLASPLAIRLLEQHPDLFSGRGIIPAIEISSDGLLAEAEKQNEKHRYGVDAIRLREHVELLEQQIECVMPWDATDIQTRFKAVLMDGLRNPHSHISRILDQKGVDAAGINVIADEIDGLDLTRSEALWHYLDGRDAKISGDLRRFAQSAYHIVGTGVVCCETGTDLHPLSKFKSVDALLAGDTDAALLSDEALFLEAFMGYALNAIGTMISPTQIIDALTFTDAHDLSVALHEQGFQDAYEGVIQEYARTAALPDASEALDSLDVEMIAHVAEKLAGKFNDEILKGLADYRTATEEAINDEIVMATADIAKDGAGQIPGVNNIIAAYDGAVHTIDLAKATYRKLAIRDPDRLRAEGDRRRAEAISEAIGKLDVSSKKRDTFADAAALLSDVHQIRTKRL